MIGTGAHAGLWVGLAGLCIGFMLGFLAYRARLCTFGAIEDALIGHDWRRMRVFALALVIAIGGTQALIAFDVLDPDLVTYLPQRLPIAGLVVGGLMFGLGMAFVGTCGFGSLIRLGSGDLRALVVILVFGVFAYATLRGVLSDIRLGLIERIALPMPGPSRSDLATQAHRWLGVDLRWWFFSGLAALSLASIWRDPRLMRARRLLTAGIGLGLAVVLGWMATSLLSDPFDLRQHPQSLTFVAPVARTLFGVLVGQDSLVDFGVMSVLGVAGGALVASLVAREFRWEAFDDHHEMRRHLFGAILMGVGGVLAGGCTIGQGLAAGSLLALSMPIALFCMIVGARLGIAIIVGDLAYHWMRLRARFARA